MGHAILVLGITGAAHAGGIAGIVTDAVTARPVTGASITVLETGTADTTDSAGRYELAALEVGSYNLLFAAAHYGPLVRNDVYVAGKATVRADAALLPSAGIEVDRMTVKASSFAKAPDMTASSRVMNFDELLRAPGALLDAQRAVQSMPGVSSGADNLNEIIVRGGAPGENLFIMDNIEIANPNHFAAQGGGGGVISLVNPLLVKGLVFSSGAPPAQYGGKASSVLDIALRDGNEKMLLGGVDIGIGGAGFHAEGPLWPGATFMASGTRSFLDLVANFEESTAIPDYWGAQAKATQKMRWGTLTMNTIYGKSGIGIDNADVDLGTRGEKIESGGIVYAAGLTAAGLIGNALSSVVSVSASGNTFVRKEFTPERPPSPEVVYYGNGSSEGEQTLKAQLGIDVAHGVRLLTGGLVRRADFDIDLEQNSDTMKSYLSQTQGEPVLNPVTQEPVIVRPFQSNHAVGYKYGGFVSAIMPMGRVRLIPGFRLDGFDYNRSFSVSPRISGALSLTDGLDLTAAFGIQYQDPSYADLVVSSSNRALAPIRAMTGIGGVEHTWPKLEAKASVEGYYKEYRDLPVDSSYLTGNSLNRFTATNTLISLGTGRCYGVEAYLQKKLTRNFSGSAAYSFSRSLREDLRPGHEDIFYPADFDFRQNCSVTGGYKFELLDRAWYRSLHERLWFRLLSPISPVADRMEISVQWRYLGGRPFTAPAYDSLHRLWEIRPDMAMNSDRYPPYHRLDLRFERRFGFGFLHLIYYFDIQNVYDRRNVWQYLFVDGNRSRSTIHQLPFFPAGGIIVGF